MTWLWFPLLLLRRLGIEVVYDDEAVRKLPRLLKSGFALGLLSDQAGLGAATHVPFFGRPARTPRGASVSVTHAPSTSTAIGATARRKRPRAATAWTKRNEME